LAEIYSVSVEIGLVAEIGFAAFAEFRIDEIAKLLCGRSRSVCPGGLLLAFFVFLSGSDHVVRIRLDGEKFPGRLVQSVVFWESGGTTRCTNSERCRHFLIPVACCPAVTEVSFVVMCFL
jgi:hypothetical protein